MPDGTKAGKPNVDLAEAIANFGKSLSALREFVAVVGSMLTDRQKAMLAPHAEGLIPMMAAIRILRPDFLPSDSRLERLLAEREGMKFKIKKTGEQTCEIDFKEGRELTTEAVKILSSTSGQQWLLYSSALISLISSAEWFLSQVLRKYIIAYPQPSGVLSKQLSLTDLRNIGSIEDAERYLIDLRVDEIMWGGWMIG